MMSASGNRQLYIWLILFALLVILNQLGYLSPVRALVQSALVPLLRPMTLATQEFAAWTAQTDNLQALQAKNDELETLNNKLMVENVRLREVERENELFRQLLNYTRTNPQFAYQTTSVIGRSIGVDPTNLIYFVFVDIGARDGIAKGMPVITDRGLVGRVTAVGPNSAQVLLLIDPASSVNVLVQNSRATGVVRGNIDGTLLMERIPQSDRVNPGDIILTSGLGGNFPDKLVVGQVTEVIQRDQDMFQSARIRPTVDFGKLETMLILTSFEPVDFEAEILRAQEDGN
jgi:rod shape-determining protein MreC